MTIVFITADGKKVSREAIASAVVSSGSTAKTVGFTVYAGAGTTLSGEVLAIGSV